MFRRLGVYKGMLLSYLAITLVALSLVGSFMLWMIHSNLYAQYASRHLADFNRMMGILEDQFNACKTIAAQISYNEGLTYQVMTQNNYNTILGINSLRMYASGNAYLEDLALCFRDVDTIYSYRGTETLGTTVQYRIRSTKEEALALSRTIQETTTLQYLLVAGGRKLAVLIPIPLNSIVNNGCALFLFDTRTIGSLCAMQEEGAHMLVLRSDGTLLMDLYDGAGELRAEQFSGIQSALAGGKRGYTHNVMPGIDAVLGHGGITGLSYAYLISPNNILREVADVMLLCLSIVGVAIGICLVLAVWFSKRYFRPVQLLQSMLPTDVESATRDEFEHIRLTMAKTLRQKNIIADQYEAQRMYLMKAALSQLLSRENRSHADRALPAHLHKHLFQYPNFFTMFVSQPSVNWDLMPMERAMAVVVPSDLEDMILLVVNFEAGDAPEDRRRALAEELIEILYMDAAAGVSAWCSGVEALAQVHDEALRALHYRLLHQPDGERLIFHQLSDQEAAQLPGFQAQYAALGHLVQQGDAEGALEVLNAFSGQLLYGDSARYHLYKLIDLLLNIAQECRDAALIHEISQIMENPRPSELRLTIRTLCERVKALHQERQDKQLSEVLAYIRDNFMNPDISLMSIADQFGNTGYYWSRYIKERTGRNFTDLIWDERTAVVKRELLTTERTIAQIVQDVGYHDLPSFTRRFKKQEGVTPGQYRQRRRLADA